MINSIFAKRKKLIKNLKKTIMKGNEKILTSLNLLLSKELAAINQYILHAEMCSNWGYKRLHDVNENRARSEMKHAEKLINRILFLEGFPNVSNLGKITIGKDVEEQLKLDNAAEMDAIQSYNEAILLATENADSGTVEFLEGILIDEENHLNIIETQQSQIAQMDLKNFLVEQTI